MPVLCGALAAVILVLPLLLVLWLRWPATRASLTTALVTLVIAIALGAAYCQVVDALFKAAVTTAKIVAIVAAALAFYSAYRVSGYEDLMKSVLAERRGQVLTLALTVYFGGFLEAISGYGTPAIVSGGVLLSLGYRPEVAAAAALVGHGWAVPYAAFGVPTLVICDVANADPQLVALYTGFLLTPAIAATLVVVAYRLGVRIRYALALSLAAPIYAVASAYVGTAAGAATGIGVFLAVAAAHRTKRLIAPLTPLILLSAALAFAKLMGFRGMVEATAIIGVAAAALTAYSRRWSKMASEIRLVVRPLYSTAVVTASLSMVSELMKSVGMVSSLVHLVAPALGRLFIVITPLLGAVGAYITGSCTTSNLLLGLLQYEYARAVGVSPAIALALQNAGGGVGSVSSLSKTTIASSSLGITGSEGKVMRLTLPMTALLVVVLSAEAAVALVWGVAAPGG